MILIAIEEVLMDSVTEAARVFNCPVPREAVFGMDQLRKVSQMDAGMFRAVLAGSTEKWADRAERQVWAERLLAQLIQADVDFRILGFCRPGEHGEYARWTERCLGQPFLRRLVLVADDFDFPAGPGDILVDASERRGRQWTRRNGRLVRWVSYTNGHSQANLQWLAVFHQVVHCRPSKV